MINNKRVCIFVDGENLRHSLVELFQIENREYIPKGNWDGFFDWISIKAAGQDADRVRTYWYVVQNLDFTPYQLNNARKDKITLEKALCRDETTAKLIARTIEDRKESLLTDITNKLLDQQDVMEKRFAGWTYIQDEMARQHRSIEFRRAGSIRYNLFDKSLGSEKAVDVKLATDLIILKNIYHVAVIVSGDQDYVPAVNAVKDFGKRIVNVAFRTKSGQLLPGGAKRLSQATDWSLEIDFDEINKFFKLKDLSSKPTIQDMGESITV